MAVEDAVFYWLLLAAVFIGLEFLVPGGIVSFVGLAAAVVGLSIYLGWISTWIGALTSLVVLSVIFLVVLRTFALRFMPSQTEIGNPEDWSDAVGKVVEVFEEIPVRGEGRIHYSGSTWLASIGENSYKREAIPAKARVKILGRQGQVWLVEAE